MTANMPVRAAAIEKESATSEHPVIFMYPVVSHCRKKANIGVLQCLY